MILIRDCELFVMAKAFAVHSTDRSRKVGCVIAAPNGVVLTAGYNSFTKGADHTKEERHERPAKYQWTEHAERNANTLPVPTIHGTTPAVYSAIVAANASLEPKQPTKRELGKLRRQTITVTKQLLACGHRVAVGIAPRNNCDTCWLTHFRTIPGLTWTDDAGKPYDSVTPELVAQVTAARGEKYAKRLRWYLSVNVMMHTVQNGKA